MANDTVQDGQALIFPTVDFNIGTAYDSQTGVFTTPTDGTYLFTARLCTNDKDVINYAIVVDGSDVTHGVHFGNTHDCASFNVMAILKAGNEVWVTCFFPGNKIAADEYRWNTFAGVVLY